LGLGTTVTSAIFLAAIVLTVAYLTVTKKDATEAQQAPGPEHQVLVVAHKTAATPALLEAIRARAARGPARFHLLVPNPAEHAELTEAERHQKHLEGEHVLALALPLIDEVSGGAADGSVSFRHDPMDAIEEALQAGSYQGIILSTLPRSVSRWLHVDLPHRVAHIGLPGTTVIAKDRSAGAVIEELVSSARA